MAGAVDDSIINIAVVVVIIIIIIIIIETGYCRSARDNYIKRRV